MKRKDNKTVILKGMGWMRVFTAMQCLMAPTKFYRVTHKRARQVITDELGFCPKGKPGTEGYTKGHRQGGTDAMLDWLGVIFMDQLKEPGIVTKDDSTLLVMKEVA
jgi:hypothetical protein